MIQIPVSAWRQAVIAEARAWLGTPFHHGAMVKGAGVDCGSFLIAVYGAVSLSVPVVDWGAFPKDWQFHTTEEHYYNLVTRYAKPVEQPKSGDMALVRFNRPDKPVRPYCHGGIVVDWPLVIHAFWGKGVEYADVSRGPLAKREKVFLSPWAL